MTRRFGSWSLSAALAVACFGSFSAPAAHAQFADDCSLPVCVDPGGTIGPRYQTCRGIVNYCPGATECHGLVNYCPRATICSGGVNICGPSADFD